MCASHKTAKRNKAWIGFTLQCNNWLLEESQAKKGVLGLENPIKETFLIKFLREQWQKISI